MKYTGARIVIECLAEQGVDVVFGYPGGAILNIYDELYKHKDRVRHILTAHEQGAAHAADGYSRSTGKTGVVLATSGPGATNLVTGIATAYMDSVPLIAITCNVACSLLGKDSFQEVDITGITMPITKHNYIVRDVAKLADTIREAFVIAQSGRPGPVLIDIPKDVTAAVAEYEPPVCGIVSEEETALARASIRRVTKEHIPSDAEIESAVQLINASVRPFLYIGGGVIISDACAELKAFAERANIPVSVSLMGKSAFPSAHPLCCGMIGMHGTKAANTGANKSDLIIAIGARFSDRVISDPSKFAKNSKILHIDIDPAEINKNIPTCGALVGNIKDILARLLPLVAVRSRSAWNDQVEEWKKHVPAMYSKKTKLHPKFVFEKIHELLGDDTIITTEVGQHQMWTAQFYPFANPRTFLTSGGLGTMGYGTGAAIGAQIANPSRHVVHIAGDGSFRMNCNELATVAHYKLPIIIIVVNNGVLGMVRQWQNLFYDKRYSETTLDFAPDFVKLAEAYGIDGYRAMSEAEFSGVFARAVAARKPAVIDCGMNIDEMVLPMVPAGKPIDELLLDI
ncbi:biosynthetic-type acetolactate synthase large subunit [Treponema brennaborense]|uniref:Acetolactate synthase n=1 Tax=Treponema brennaborense (strain DSM 12168 / CIP 105900 / DD5/3) TaxID=906968 RepID=F4LIF4_TREBD|nr:biosynthetic-type acetolactate synthase large subunit [Treponema brennaborense]AEE16195.1 acetolactate synthase, large subunit, biosynthetic type [Treponema brennaborense DSM 12168]